MRLLAILFLLMLYLGENMGLLKCTLQSNINVAEGKKKWEQENKKKNADKDSWRDSG